MIVAGFFDGAFVGVYIDPVFGWAALAAAILVVAAGLVARHAARCRQSRYGGTVDLTGMKRTPRPNDPDDFGFPLDWHEGQSDARAGVGDEAA